MVSPGSLPSVNKVNLVHLVHKIKKKVVDDEKKFAQGVKVCEKECVLSERSVARKRAAVD